MATTTLLQRHAGEGETIAEAIRDCLDYGKDPEKTESGKYISAYECDPATVADEFLLAKASYAAMTGREQKKENNVLCYQIRQSFYPGEITPKEANRMPKPAQSLSSIRRRSTAGNSLRSMRPTLNCTGLHKRKCALCWAGRSSPKWMC